MVSLMIGNLNLPSKLINDFHLLTTLNRPVPNVISATKYGCTKPQSPPPSPSSTCVESKKASPESFHRMMSAQRIGKVNSPAMKRGFRPTPLMVSRSPPQVARAIVIWAVTIAPAISGMAPRRGVPASSPTLINSPKTKRTLALAKLQNNPCVSTIRPTRKLRALQDTERVHTVAKTY
jgi:hypothetical protein